MLNSPNSVTTIIFSAESCLSDFTDESIWYRVHDARPSWA